jgi:hypothetical protein
VTNDPARLGATSQTTNTDDMGRNCRAAGNAEVGMGCPVIYHAAGTRLYSHHVRVAAFTTRWRGVDPEEVRATLHRELAKAHTETERAREGLRQWQKRHIGCRFSDPQWPIHTNRGPR